MGGEKGTTASFALSNENDRLVSTSDAARRLGERHKHRQVTEFSCAKCKTFSFATKSTTWARRLGWKWNTYSRSFEHLRRMLFWLLVFIASPTQSIYLCFRSLFSLTSLHRSIYMEFIKCVGLSFWVCASARAWPLCVFFCIFLCFNYSYIIWIISNGTKDGGRHSSHQLKTNIEFIVVRMQYKSSWRRERRDDGKTSTSHRRQQRMKRKKKYLEFLKRIIFFRIQINI